MEIRDFAAAVGGEVVGRLQIEKGVPATEGVQASEVVQATKGVRMGAGMQVRYRHHTHQRLWPWREEATVREIGRRVTLAVAFSIVRIILAPMEVLVGIWEGRRGRR